MNNQGKKLFDEEDVRPPSISDKSRISMQRSQDIIINHKLISYLEKYIRSYSERGKEIEIKGRLIDLIRNIH